MNVLIFGANGMLGHKVYQACRERGFEAWVTGRWLGTHPLLGGASRIYADVSCLTGKWPVAIAAQPPDAIVNCIGIVKQRWNVSSAAMFQVNAHFPHWLATICAVHSVRLIHVSTDCVFSGNQGWPYKETDVPDPVRQYGWSKLMGEVTTPRCLTLRTSFIGRQLSGETGLLEWLISKRGQRVPGYTKAWFSGLTAQVVAWVIADVLEKHPLLDGLYHVGGERISKYKLLSQLNDGLGLDLDIVPDATSVVSDHSLNSYLFHGETDRGDYTPWPYMIDELKSDPTPYDKWRSDGES